MTHHCCSACSALSPGYSLTAAAVLQWLSDRKGVALPSSLWARLLEPFRLESLVATVQTIAITQQPLERPHLALLTRPCVPTFSLLLEGTGQWPAFTLLLTGPLSSASSVQFSAKLAGLQDLIKGFSPQRSRIDLPWDMLQSEAFLSHKLLQKRGPQLDTSDFPQ